MASRIKKGDKVMIMSGKDKGKAEKVLTVFPELQKVLVENVNKVKKHRKPTQQHQGGISDMLMPIAVSRVMIVCPACHKPARVGFKILNDAQKVRYCKKCQENIDK
jgi:large subunit ribosomal protein L24